MRDGTYKPAGTTIVTIPVSPELHRRLRMHCASEGRTMKWVGTKAFENYLAALAPSNNEVSSDKD